MSKLIVVVGATGNQGGSVARRFLQDPSYKVRGLTRDINSSKAKELADLGIEVVRADLDDIDTLKDAFSGANVIFSVTNYWEPFFRPDCRAKAEAQGISCRRYAYNIEYQQGKNIADAAALTLNTLAPNGFLVSTLSHAGKRSNGKFKELYHFDAKADVFPDYVEKQHPDLAKKMSCIQTGYFTSSYKLAPTAYLARQSDGSFMAQFTTDPDKPVPHLAVNEDTGNFVYAVSKQAAGERYMAAGTVCSWTEYMRTWSEVTGLKGSYRQVSEQSMVENSPDAEFGREVADMFTYSSDPGYDGGVHLLTVGDLRDAGVECPMLTLREWMEREDWSGFAKKS